MATNLLIRQATESGYTEEVSDAAKLLANLGELSSSAELKEKMASSSCPSALFAARAQEENSGNSEMHNEMHCNR